MTAYYIGIDVGTGSARASLVTNEGKFVASSVKDIVTYRDPSDHRIFEQSTSNIWAAIAATVQSCLQTSQIDPSLVKGIGFDATCSLAVISADGQSTTVTKGPGLGQLGGERDIILWADHRAEKEAEAINATQHPTLKYVGGKMSLEMEVPKIAWLRANMSGAQFTSSHFFDLPDFLTYKATGTTTRSTCSLTAKFLPDLSQKEDFLRTIGLEEMINNEYKSVGFPTEKSPLSFAGEAVGTLSKDAAKTLGLTESTVVGSALIDAYAGWAGTIAARYLEDGKLSAAPTLEDSQQRLAVVAGTSTCHLVHSKKSVFAPGVWGPYKDAVFQGYWMNEGGQSSTGQLIDFMLTTHPAYSELVAKGESEGKNIHLVIKDLLEDLRKKEGAESLTELTMDMHFYPDLHGNRSPIADPRMRGSIMGLALDDSLSDLAKKYNLTLESIALQNRHIIEEMNTAGHSITSIFMSGGQSKNSELMQLFANVCGLPVVLPHSHATAVSLGAAILGRHAAESNGARGHRIEEGLWKVMVEMTPPGTLVKPAVSVKEKKLLDAKYKIFRESIEIQTRWRREMEVASQ